MTLRTIKKSWQKILDSEDIKDWEIDDTHSDGLVMSKSKKILCGMEKWTKAPKKTPTKDC